MVKQLRLERPNLDREPQEWLTDEWNEYFDKRDYLFDEDALPEQSDEEEGY